MWKKKRIIIFLLFVISGTTYASNSTDYSVSDSITGWGISNSSSYYVIDSFDFGIISNSTDYREHGGFVFSTVKGYRASWSNISLLTSPIIIGNRQLMNFTLTMNVTDAGKTINHNYTFSGFFNMTVPIVIRNSSLVSSFNSTTNNLNFTQKYLSNGKFIYNISFNATLIQKIPTLGRDCNGYTNLSDYCEFTQEITTASFSVTTTAYIYRIKVFINVTKELVNDTAIHYKFPKTWLTDGYLDWSNRDSFYDKYTVNGTSAGLSITEDIENVTIIIGTNYGSSSLHIGEYSIVLEWGKLITYIFGTTNPPINVISPKRKVGITPSNKTYDSISPNQSISVIPQGNQSTTILKNKDTFSSFQLPTGDFLSVAKSLKEIMGYKFLCFGTKDAVTNECLVPFGEIMKGVSFNITLIDVLYTIVMGVTLYLFFMRKTLTYGIISMIVFLMLFISRLILF